MHQNIQECLSFDKISNNFRNNSHVIFYFIMLYLGIINFFSRHPDIGKTDCPTIPKKLILRVGKTCFKFFLFTKLCTYHFVSPESFSAIRFFLHLALCLCFCLENSRENSANNGPNSHNLDVNMTLNSREKILLTLNLLFDLYFFCLKNINSSNFDILWLLKSVFYIIMTTFSEKQG